MSKENKAGDIPYGYVKGWSAEEIKESRLEKERAKFCMDHCPFPKKCVDCLASATASRKKKALKHMLEIGIPEKLARDMIIGGKNL